MVGTRLCLRRPNHEAHQLPSESLFALFHQEVDILPQGYSLEAFVQFRGGRVYNRVREGSGPLDSFFEILCKLLANIGTAMPSASVGLVSNKRVCIECNWNTFGVCWVPI